MVNLNRTDWLAQLNANSVSDRPWVKTGYRFRPMSQHSPEGHVYRAERPYFGWVHVEVDNIDLTMFSNNDDGVAGVYHAFGPDAYESASVAAWLEISRKSRNILDIGAFTGLFGMLAQRAAPNASVIAVEPNGAVRARLMMNIVVNGLYPQLQVLQYAVAAEVGVLPLHIGLGADLLDTGGSIVNSNAHTTRTETVAVISIDALVQQKNFDSVDLVKIDVEGAEIGTLHGARKTLEQGPTLFLEIQGAKEFAECWDILRPHGYQIFGVDDDSINLIPYDGSDASTWMGQHVGQRVMNFLCAVRREHIDLAQVGLARIRTKIAQF